MLELRDTLKAVGRGWNTTNGEVSRSAWMKFLLRRWQPTTLPMTDSDKFVVRHVLTHGGTRCTAINGQRVLMFLEVRVAFNLIMPQDGVGFIESWVDNCLSCHVNSVGHVS